MATDVIESLGIELTSNATKANKAIDSLDARLAKLAKSLGSIHTTQITSAISGLGSQTQQVDKSTKTLSNSFDSFGKTSTRTKGKVKSLASTFGSLYANFFWVIRGANQLGKAIESSMDYVETYNYFNVTMDKIGKEWSKDYKQWGYDTAEAYAESFQSRIQALNKKMTGYELGKQGEATYTGAKNLGLDVETMMNYQASIGAVTNSLGLMGEVSVNTQKAMSMLAADLSSFKNIDLSSVMTNLQSGLIGQSRALYKYGIDITNATMQTYAYELGLSKAVSEMSQAEKMQLRVLMILDQSKVAWGDQANTLNSVANQYRILKQQFGNLARTIGNLFLPIVEKVLPVVNGLVIALNELLQAFGISLWGENWLTDIMTGTSAGYTDDSLEHLEDDATGASDALEDTSKNAKKLKNNLLGIDKLNIISLQDDSDSDKNKGKGNEIDLSKQIASAVADYEKVWEKAFKRSENLAQKYAERITKAFGSGDWESVGAYWSNKLSETLKNIPWENVYKNAENFGENLAEFLNGLISPKLFKQLGKTIANSINTIFGASNSFGKNLKWSRLGKTLASGIKSFFVNWDAKLSAETLSTFAKGFLTSATSALQELANNNSFEVLGQKLVDFICNIDWLGVVWNLNEFFKSLANAMGEFPADLAEGIVEGIAQNVFGKKNFDFEVPEGVKSGLGKNLSPTQANKSIKPLLFAVEIVKDPETQNKISQWYNEEVKPWFTKEKWKKIFENIKKSFEEKWNEISTWWTNTAVSKWFNDAVKPWFTKEKWKKLFENIKVSLQEKWNEVVSWWNSTGISNWYNNNVKPWFTKEKWNFSGIGKGLEEAWNNAIKTIKQTWNTFAEWLNKKLVFSWDSVSIGGKTLIDSGEIKLGKIPTFETYETGGFPEDGFFFANHTELVGRFSNGKTAVANNKQITDGIEEAAYRGYMRAMASQIGSFNNKPQRIEIPVVFNGREVARIVNEENARNGTQILGYESGY